MASDISVGAHYAGPYEVKDAGDGKGMGAFATRDIRAGETILVDFTPIIYEEKKYREEYLEDVIKMYESIDESEKKAWSDLYEYYNEERGGEYFVYYSELRPDGTQFSEEEIELYTHLALVLDCNVYGTAKTETGLFVHASRFNHSCDPNMWYLADIKRGRWVGRAARNIAAGEELTVSYLVNHASKAERHHNCQSSWGFTCGCKKCNGEPDTYTESLERAWDEASGRDGDDDEIQGHVYSDTVNAREIQVATRINLLRDIVKLTGDDGTAVAKARKKELAIALYDGSCFHRHYFSVYKQRKDREERVRHLHQDEEYITEALAVARTVWPTKHEMVKSIQVEIRQVREYMKKYDPQPEEDPEV
ncbi:SET domain-containing protein [Xylariaceae sp. AK1471]|nr:SET domain-containing protein [Xylariaceae sp. AK1471]